MRNVSKTSALAFGIVLLVVAGVNGDTITGVLSAPVSSDSSPIDISSGTADWAYYGLHTDFTPDTKSGGPASFSNVTTTGSTGLGGDSRTCVSFSGGTPNSSVTAGRNYVYDMNSVSITHKLLADSETVSFYLVGCATHFDLSATLGSATYSATNLLLPYTDDDVHYSGILTLTVSGKKGDTLIFTNATNTRTEDWSSVAIQAASVVANVPEPATSAISLSALVALMAYAWRKRK